MLTADRLREVLIYDPVTGAFTWRAEQCATHARVGVAAGSLRADGYLRIKIDGRTYRAHRLAWLYMTGEWPTQIVDHEDRNRANNAWRNLRPSNNGANLQNRDKPRRGSKSGLLGASWDASRAVWVAVISANGTTERLGRFSTAQEAHAAYMQAKARLHPTFSPTL